MKIKNVAIKNFRGYSDEINSDFEDLTAFVGKNDIGKSTILIFFGIRRAQLFLPYLLTIELNMTAYGIADIVTFRLILNLVISAQLMTKSLPM